MISIKRVFNILEKCTHHLPSIKYDILLADHENFCVILELKFYPVPGSNECLRISPAFTYEELHAPDITSTIEKTVKQTIKRLYAHLNTE